MCGLVGVVSTGVLSAKEKEIFQELLMVDSVRGHHATGVMAFSRYNHVDTFKRAVNSQEYLMYKNSDTVLNQNCVAIGHNRWATAGDKSNHAYAHPFQHGDITGVHNGTLRNQSDLPDSQHFEVDSENIFWAMEKDGIEETIKKLEGAFALIFHDKQTGTINFIRNSERPLAIAKVNASTFYVASEAKMLDWVLSREKNKSIRYTNYEIIELPIGELWSLEIGKGFNAIEKTKVELKKKPTVITAPAWSSRGGTSTTYKGKRLVSPKGVRIGDDVRFCVNSTARTTNGLINVYGTVALKNGDTCDAVAYQQKHSEYLAHGVVLGGKVTLVNSNYNKGSVQVSQLTFAEIDQPKKTKPVVQ